MKLYGLMITKDAPAALDAWCRDQLRLYDAVVCLDGFDGREGERVTDRYGDRVIYLHERDHPPPTKTDHGLRSVVHREIVRRFGLNNWVMCCHADEFCYHDPRKIAVKAAREGYDCVTWYSLHFYPHPSERPNWRRRQALPVVERWLHYHWDYRGTSQPWKEDRLYRNGPQVAWDDNTHGVVRPHQLSRPAPFHPVLRHYKVMSLDLDAYERRGDSTYYRGHWQDQGGTGLSFPVRSTDDLFVTSVLGYARCDRLECDLDQPWNMGAEFCPDADVDLCPLR
jgi:hypothetical protein